MEITKQTSAQIICSESSTYGGESINITVRSYETQGDLTKLHCAVIQRLDADYLYDDIMAYDVGIKFIVNIYLNTDDLWNTTNNKKRLLDMHGFRVELEEIPEIELGSVDSRLPAGTDAYILYKSRREKVFGANFFSNIDIELQNS